MSKHFSNLSIQLTNKLSKDTKKEQGIYFTPLSIISNLVDETLTYFDEEPKYVLEPSCGSCEIVNYIDKKLVDSTIDCIEFNKDIYNEICNLQFENDVTIVNTDFTTTINGIDKYDLIIGNPPYFVCKKEYVPHQYSKYIVGRPNIFGIFILHSLTKLKMNGYLSFIIPKSFLNSSYYSSIRNYIKQTCKIIKIIDYGSNNDFLETSQSTFGLIIQKINQDITNIHECNYSIKINNSFIFTSDAYSLKKYFENSTTLKKMGLSVKTGTIVWNEKKEFLTNDENNTILLYNTNITNDNKIKLTTFKNDSKFQYIYVEGDNQPVIVVNRGNGNASYNFKYALVELDMPFVVENHLNIIYLSNCSMSKDELLVTYNKIITSFENKKTKEFIKLFFGNNGLSKTELETILPIYL
uniref:site-specific DNA-methyltransferase (adenine-specific) n=1 Tax=viral metagenome TaxID=1070528 RepID=A0A6C0IVJ7_9ZZZZ